MDSLQTDIDYQQCSIEMFCIQVKENRTFVDRKPKFNFLQTTFGMETQAKNIAKLYPFATDTYFNNEQCFATHMTVHRATSLKHEPYTKLKYRTLLRHLCQLAIQAMSCSGGTLGVCVVQCE